MDAAKSTADSSRRWDTCQSDGILRRIDASLSTYPQQLFETTVCKNATAARRLASCLNDISSRLVDGGVDAPMRPFLDGLSYRRSAPLRHMRYWQRIKGAFRIMAKVKDQRLFTLLHTVKQKMHSSAMISSLHLPHMDTLRFVASSLLARIYRLCQAQVLAAAATDEIIGILEMSQNLVISRVFIATLAELSGRAANEAAKNAEAFESLRVSWREHVAEEERSKQSWLWTLDVSSWREFLIGCDRPIIEKKKSKKDGVWKWMDTVVEEDTVVERDTVRMGKEEEERERKRTRLLDVLLGVSEQDVAANRVQDAALGVLRKQTLGEDLGEAIQVEEDHGSGGEGTMEEEEGEEKEREEKEGQEKEREAKEREEKEREEKEREPSEKKKRKKKKIRKSEAISGGKGGGQENESSIRKAKTGEERRRKKRKKMVE